MISYFLFFFQCRFLKTKVLFVSITSVIILARILTSWTVIRISDYTHESKFVANNYCNKIYQRTDKEYKIAYTKKSLDKMRWASKCLKRIVRSVFPFCWMLLYKISNFHSVTYILNTMDYICLFVWIHEMFLIWQLINVCHVLKGLDDYFLVVHLD